MGAKIKRVLKIVGWVVVALGVLLLVSWWSWNEGIASVAPSPIIAPAASTPASVSTPTPAPVPAPPQLIVNPPAVNVTVTQTVNGIVETTPPASPPAKPTASSFEVVTGDFEANVYDADRWHVGSFKELTIDHLWGSAGPINRTDNFRVIWGGSISVPESGGYRFKVVADGGVQLFVDDYLIIDKKSLASQSVVEHTGVINLTAGQHEVVLKYYETTGDATIRLLYVKIR